MNVDNILVLTGTRAEYGLLKSTMRAISDHDDMSLSVVATGMHLSPRHGRTINDIREDGFTIDRQVHMLFEGDSGTAMAKSLGAGTAGLAEAFESLDPDVVVLLGDRGEALAGALAAAHMNVPIAHIHGGDAMNGATIDESIRHAITKFAHLHFPASEAAATRIENLGEEPWRITTAGAPGLDDIHAGEYSDSQTVLEAYRLNPSERLCVVVQHPVTTEPEQAGTQMETTLDALDGFDGQLVLIYPNADAGGEDMIDVIESRSFGPTVHTFRNMPRRDYLGLLAAADLLVGNSSSGIIEAPSLNLPVVDVGPRQDGRLRAENVISVPYDIDLIREGIQMCLDEDHFRSQVENCDNPYDYGGAASKICARLESIDRSLETILRKRMTY